MIKRRRLEIEYEIIINMNEIDEMLAECSTFTVETVWYGSVDVLETENVKEEFLRMLVDKLNEENNLNIQIEY